MKRALLLIVVVVLAAALFAGCDALKINDVKTETPSGEPEAVEEALPQETAIAEIPEAAPEESAQASAEASAEPSAAPSAQAQSTTQDANKNNGFAFKADKIDLSYYDVALDKKVDAEIALTDKTDINAGFKAVNDIIVVGSINSEPMKAEITFDGESLTIDLDKSVYDLNLGSAGESEVLTALADVYLNNSDMVKRVFILADGKPYSSGHIELAEGEPFKAKAGFEGIAEDEE